MSSLACLTAHVADRLTAWRSLRCQRGNSRRNNRLCCFQAGFNSRRKNPKDLALRRLGVNACSGEGGDLAASDADENSGRVLLPDGNQVIDSSLEKFSLDDVISEQVEEAEKAARIQRENQTRLEDCVVFAEERDGDKKYLEVMVTSVHQVDHGKHIPSLCNVQQVHITSRACVLLYLRLDCRQAAWISVKCEPLK